MANLDYDQVFADKADYIGSAVSDPKEFDAFQFEMDMMVERLTTNLLNAFKSFIEQVEFPESVKYLSIPRDALFFNFNYTHTLEYYYKVPPNHILHIHNKAFDNEDLVLGHGTDPDQFIMEEEKPPENATEEDLDRWNEHMADQYNPTFENGRHSLWTYFTKSNKTTDAIILKNNDFFNRLNGVTEVFVLGHSLSEVDHPYFKKIIDSIASNANWTVTYYLKGDQNTHLNTLKKIGIPEHRISLIRMDDLKVEKTGELFE